MSDYVNKDGKFNHCKWIREKSQPITEISVKAGLDDVMKGRTTSIEGIKISKDMASSIMDWMAMSAYGRKYHKQIMKGRIASLIGPANAMGIERFLTPAGKKEWKAIYAKHGPKREAVNERISRDAYKRMDGLHSYKKLDQALKIIETIYMELDEEMFEPDEILEFLMMKIEKQLGGRTR